MQVVANSSFALEFLNGAIIWIFILAMLTFASSIALRSFILFLGQFVLFFGFFASSLTFSTSLIIFILVIQTLLTLYLVYRIQQAVKYNYDLIREKTHLQPRDITTKSYTGTKFTF